MSKLHACQSVLLLLMCVMTLVFQVHRCTCYTKAEGLALAKLLTGKMLGDAQERVLWDATLARMQYTLSILLVCLVCTSQKESKLKYTSFILKEEKYK